MRVLGDISEIRRVLDAARAAGRNIGFVPTMGALHDGHLSLIRRARSGCDVVCVSIFVNPAQFGPHEDLAAYPRPLEADLEACRREGVDLVFSPEARELYPEPPLTTVRVGGLSDRMEGAMRPGHLEGVALVCTKLFAIVGACRAYFGEKDAQQLRVVRRLAADLNLPVDVIACPTVRESDGLALSSRNVYLSAAERERALVLPRALQAVERAIRAGERDPAAALAEAAEVLERDPPDAVDYVEIVDPSTFEAIERVMGPVLVCGAIRVGRTRLIDNIGIDTSEEAPAKAGSVASEGRR